MKSSKFGAAIFALLAATACGTGTPATVEEAEKLLSEKMTDDDTTITWIKAIPQEEPGTFRVFADAVSKSDPKDTETKLCEASVTSNSNSYSCTSGKPGILDQAANEMISTYKARNVAVDGYEFSRTGKDMDFAGYMDISDPASGETLRVTCKGEQNDTKFNINCNS